MSYKLYKFMLVIAFGIGGQAMAATADITGLWQQIDEKSGQVHSLLHIEIKAGEAGATIVKGYPVLAGRQLEPNPLCRICPGEFKNKPLIGMRLMWGLKGEGGDWDGGKILDPDEGKIYDVKLGLSEDGSNLDVRGYLGVSVFGRTQTWRRFNGAVD
jgi:uncharacterized protein (DUF2147 family)